MPSLENWDGGGGGGGGGGMDVYMQNYMYMCMYNRHVERACYIHV